MRAGRQLRPVKSLHGAPATALSAPAQGTASIEHAFPEWLGQDGSTLSFGKLDMSKEWHHPEGMPMFSAAGGQKTVHTGNPSGEQCGLPIALLHARQAPARLCSPGPAGLE
jgi:hypothetical protein